MKPYLKKIKSLILQREQIDRELEAILGDATPTRRGRPRKMPLLPQTALLSPINAI